MFSIRKYSDGAVVLAAGRRMLRCEYDPETVTLTASDGLLYIRASRVAPDNNFRFTAEDQVEGATAIYCILDCWTRPWFGKDFGALPELTQLLLWRERDLWCVLLPVSDRSNVFLKGIGGGEARASFECEADAGQLMLIMAAGHDPYELAERAAHAAMREVDPDAVPLERRKWPEMFDYLGWCTWDACYRGLNEPVVREKFREFREKGIPVRWAILDDGWQTMREEKLDALEADAEKFPRGFRAMKEELVREYGLRWLGVWHALSAFYNGIHPESPLIERYRAELTQNGAGEYYPAPEFAKAYRFFSDWYAYLRAEGVDFVKVDLQSWATYLYYRGERNPVDVAWELSGAAEAAGTAYFDGRVLNCMGMREENVFHRSYTAVARGSKDYIPPTKTSTLPPEQRGFQEHAIQNAYNAIFHDGFIHGDWDMWWSSHNDAVLNAVLRAVSGGPVYVSDRVGETDPAVLNPLVFSDGRVVRCDAPGRPARGCLLRNPYAEKVPLKIFNRLGRCGVLAVFHLYRDGGTLPCAAGLEDAEGAGPCIAYEYFSQTARRLEDGERISLTLEPGEARLYTFYPADAAVVPLGLADKYIPAAGIVYIRRLTGRTVVLLRDGGRFAFYAARRPREVCVDGAPAAVEAGGELYYVNCGPGAHCVEIRA